jgi:hypothetical protein
MKLSKSSSHTQPGPAQTGMFFRLPWYFYAVLSALMKIPALFMTVSGFTVIEGDKLKFLMGMLGFAVAVKSWAAEKDVVLVWYGPKSEKNPILVHFVAAVFFFLCVSANSLNQFVTHQEALAGEVNAKQASNVYHRNRETLATTKSQIATQVAAQLPGAMEKLRTEIKRLRQAAAAGEPISTNDRDTLAAEVKGLQDASAIVGKLDPLPLDAPANADVVLAAQLDQLRTARAKLPTEIQKLIDDPRPAEKPQVSTRPVRLWMDATIARTPDGRLSWVVGFILEALPLLTWLMGAKSIRVADRIRRRRAWFREVREAFLDWKGFQVDYVVEPLGFSGSWRVETDYHRFSVTEISGEVDSLCEAMTDRLGQAVTVVGFRNNDGEAVDPDEALLPRIGSGPLVIDVALADERTLTLHSKEPRQ